MVILIVSDLGLAYGLDRKDRIIDVLRLDLSDLEVLEPGGNGTCPIELIVVLGDHGLEIFDDTTVGATIVVLYGENLVDKLRMDVLTKSSDLIDNLTTNDGTKALSAKQGKLLSDQIANLVERQIIPVSGFDGNMKETELTITLKQGYKPYLLQAVTSQFDTSHYIHYTNEINSSTGKFYIEHNLTSAVTAIAVCILWIPNSL